MAQISKSNSVTREEIISNKIYSDSDGETDNKANAEIRKSTSLTSLIIWNVTKALELNPKMQVKVAIKAAQARLDGDIKTIIPEYPEERHLACALLAWQQLGHSETDSLCAFIDNRLISDTKENNRKLTDKDVENSKQLSQSFVHPKKNLFKIDCYSMGPVIKLPTEPKIVMRLETNSCARSPGKCPKPAPEQEILNKIEAACCMDTGCKERLQAMDAATTELRTRAAKLARREAERVELLERAEIAWKDLELGYQRRLTLAEEKEEDIGKQIKKAIEERNNFKKTCMQLAKQLKEKSDLAEKDRTQLSNVDKEIVYDRACARQRISEESAKIEASLTEHQSKAAQFERDLTFNEEQLRRKMLSIESELESARALTHEAERAMRAELAALKDQVVEMSKQLLTEDAESESIKELLTDMRLQKIDLVEDLEGCKKVCDGNMQVITDELKKKREHLAQIKEQVMECRCKIPVDASVEVKRTPSLAALCHCTAEDKILEACSCTSIRGRLLNNLLSDLFNGLQAELGEMSSADMPCQLLKCLEDKHNWDRSSIVKTNLKNYFSQLLLGELDIAITNSIEKYHAKWLGETCADTIGKMTPDPSESASEEGWQQRVIEKRAQKLAAELAEELFQQRADQLTQQAKEYVAKLPPPCECKPANTDAAVYPCLVKTTSQLDSGPKTQPPWKEAMKDVTQLRMQIEDLKKESIKKQDLKQMELKITKIMKQASCSENNKTDANLDSNVLKRDQKLNRGFNTNSNVTQNKYGLIKKKLTETANKKGNKLTVANNMANSANDKNSKLKKFGQSYATNPCFCSEKEPTKLTQKNKARSNGVNYGICKPKTSFIVNNVMTSKLEGTPLPENCSLICESPREDKQPFVCFHRVPSNTSIDRLLETLAKWKTNQDQQEHKETIHENHQSEVNLCHCPATKKSSTSLKRRGKPKKHDCLSLERNENSRKSSAISLKSKQSSTTTTSLRSKKSVTKEGKPSGCEISTCKILAKGRNNQDQQQHKEITQNNRQSELIPCQCPAKKKSSTSLKRRGKPKKHDCLNIERKRSYQNENSRKSSVISLKSKQSSTTTTTSLRRKKSVKKDGNPSGCKIKTCVSSTTKINKKKTPSMCSIKACKSKEKTNRKVSVNANKPYSKSTDSVKKVESEYMGAVNLDKSNEDACKCFNEKDKTKLSRTTNAPILPNNLIKCITSSKCNCDNVLKRRSNPSKDNAKTDPLQDIQKDANKCVIQYISENNSHFSDKNLNNLKPAPDCNYNIRFLGVTLADVNSKKQHVEFAKESDETQTSNSTFDRYIPTDIMCTAECGCLVEPDYIQSVKNGGGETVCCISEQYKINKKDRIDTERFDKISSCEYVEQFGEYKNFIDIALQHKSSNKDKSLDTQSFVIPTTEKDNCVCCKNSYGAESKELEKNAFHLLQEHLKQKLEEFKETSCQSSCIPPEEEERLFSTILKRVKKVISDSTNKISCKCSDKAEDGQGTWSRAYSLLQEYLKMKIKRVQCSCVLGEDDKNTILPEVLDKVSNLIESDFKRLKDVCECQRKKDISNQDKTKSNFTEETPEKDANIEFKTFSDKPNSRRSINQESVLLQVSDYFGLDAKSCDPMESFIQKYNVSQDVQSFQSINNEHECNCAHKEIDSVIQECSCDHKTNDAEILEPLPYHINKNNISMVTGELDKIKLVSKLDHCLTVPLIKCNNDCSCNADLSQASLLTRNVYDTKKLSSKVMTKNDHFNDENYKPFLEKSHNAKSSEIKNTPEQNFQAKPIYHICDDCHRKQCNQNEIVDVEMNLENLPNSPYIGCTIECSCENKLGKCVCGRATFKPNKEISTVWKNSLQNKNYFDKVAYILNNNNVKKNDEKDCYTVMTNKSRKHDQGSKQLDTNHNKYGCETGISAISVEELILKDSNERFEIANNMTNTYDDDNSGNTDYSINEEPLDWCECCSQKKSDTHSQPKKSIYHPVLQNDDDICESETYFYLNEVKHPKHCNCDMVPICHVKMLVENIENKLASLKCTCDSLIPQVCPVHTLNKVIV